MDDLAKEFPSWSPYNYVYNNPLRFVDPDGRAPEDTYGVDSKGNIFWIDDTKYHDDDGNEVDLIINGDRLRYNRRGEIRNNHEFVKSGILKQGLNKKILRTESDGDYPYTSMNIGPFESEGIKLFEFLADNTNVEWSIMQTEPFEGLTSTSIFSSHIWDKEYAGATFALDLIGPPNPIKLNYHIHSHPPTNIRGDVSRLSPSPADRDFARKVRAAGSTAVLRVYFNGQYSRKY